MRPVALFLAAVLVACSSKHPDTSTAEASTEIPAEDGSTAGCTSLGGVCMPYTASTCPIVQRDAILCNDTVLVCCLPSGPPGTITVPEAGPQPEPDSGQPMPPEDAASPDDARNE
jgi:hypothetical protein